MSRIPSDVPIIGRQARVTLTDLRILAPASVEVRDGWLPGDNCVCHLLIAAPLTGAGYYVPLTAEMADSISKQLYRQVTQHKSSQPTEDTNHGVN